MPRSLLAVSILSSLALGCDESSSAPTAPSSATGSLTQTLTVEGLTGTWQLVSVRPPGQAEQVKPPGATYSLTFAAGRVTTRVNCNICNSPFALTDHTLTVGPELACTRAACPTPMFETTYITLLRGASTVTVADSMLVLSSPRGVLRFTR